MTVSCDNGVHIETGSVYRPSSVWFVVLFCGLMLIGLAWLLVFQLASNQISFLADLGPWNYAIAFAFMITGLLLTMKWR